MATVGFHFGFCCICEVSEMVHFKGKFSLFAIYLFYFRNFYFSIYLNVL